NDLPRDAKFILQPAAPVFPAACRELLPEVIHFFLCLAIHDERNSRGKRELRPTIQGDEFLPVDLKRRDHDRSLGSRPVVSVTIHLSNLRVLENGDIKIRRLLRFSVEPQEWRYFLHVDSLLSFCAGGRILGPPPVCHLREPHLSRDAGN